MNLGDERRDLIRGFPSSSVYNLRIKHLKNSAHLRLLGKYDSDNARVVAASHFARDAVLVSGLTIRAARRIILDRVCLDFVRGQTTALLGSNGAGKTTLLKSLAGLLRPAAGEIRWFGQTARRSPAVRMAVGFVAHQSGVYLELTPRENLTFAARMYGVTDVRSRVDAWLEETGLTRRAEQPASRLSQGMRQRLAIARACIHDPLLVLLDEPFAALDKESRAWLEALLAQWRREGRAACLTSHDRDHCATLADRLVWLCHGRIESINEMSSAAAALADQALSDQALAVGSSS